MKCLITCLWIWTWQRQDPAWKTHVWKKGGSSVAGAITPTSPKGRKGTRRKFHFKEIARAVKFTSKLFGKALSKRVKATILYATETGKSEMYARRLGEIFGHAFNAQVSGAKWGRWSITQTEKTRRRRESSIDPICRTNHSLMLSHVPLFFFFFLSPSFHFLSYLYSLQDTSQYLRCNRPIRRSRPLSFSCYPT